MYVRVCVCVCDTMCVHGWRLWAVGAVELTDGR